jgi:predicted DNA-binding transcriptional regulator AlpA
MEDGRLTLTIEEAAKLLGIGRQLAYDRARTGEIPALEKLLSEPQDPADRRPASE